MVGGMYLEHILDDDGKKVAKPQATTKEQRVKTVHILGIGVLQSTPGVSLTRMYDKRDHMETLKQYHRYPHIETRLSKMCLYATLPCQLYRFAIRCSEINFFQVAAAKLMMDMIDMVMAKLVCRANSEISAKHFLKCHR